METETSRFADKKTGQSMTVLFKGLIQSRAVFAACRAPITPKVCPALPLN